MTTSYFRTQKKSTQIDLKLNSYILSKYNPNIGLISRKDGSLSSRKGRIAPGGLEIRATQQKK